MIGVVLALTIIPILTAVWILTCILFRPVGGSGDSAYQERPVVAMVTIKRVMQEGEGDT